MSTGMRTNAILAAGAILACLTQASPAPPRPQPVAAAATGAAAAPHPLITPSPALDLPTRTRAMQQRDLGDLWGSFESGVNSVLSSLGSAIPSYVAEGVPNFFQDLPTGAKVQSSLGIDDDQVRALPTQVLNIPPYGNWSNNAWNIRFRGNVYKQPNTDQAKLDKLANVFLIDVDIKDLQPAQQAQARNVTASIFVLQQDNQNVTMHISPAPPEPGSSSDTAAANTTGGGGAQDIKLPYPTTKEGDFDVFVPIALNGLTPGDQTSSIQRLALHADGATLGNATAYLVPPRGLTIVSDIDDILRVTKIYKPKEGLLNSFANAFVPWGDMPSVYANWSRSSSLGAASETHFHYLTTTPEQATRIYMDYIYRTYPPGSFDTRPLNFSDVSATLSIRKYLLDRIFQTFPSRRFVLVGDTSNSDIMRDYPQMARDYPGQVACILLRNTSATDKDMLFPYNTKGFEGLNQSSYMFFRTTDDLKGIDVSGLGPGECYNASVPQNVTFGYQDELLGVHGGGAVLGVGLLRSVGVAMVVAMALML